MIKLDERFLNFKYRLLSSYYMKIGSSPDFLEHDVGFWNMLFRHLGRKNSLDMIRHVLLPHPIEFIRNWRYAQKEYPNGLLTNGYSESWKIPGNYYLGMEPGITIERYLERFQKKIGKDKQKLGVVVSTCTQGCIDDRSRREGGHPAAFGTKGCIDELCSYRYVNDLVKQYSDKEVHPLARTCYFVQDVLMPSLKNQEHNAFVFYVCPWARKKTSIVGANALGRTIGIPIIVSLLEGEICNQEQFEKIDTTGEVDPNVRTYIPKYGIDLLASVLGINEYGLPNYPIEQNLGTRIIF